MKGGARRSLLVLGLLVVFLVCAHAVIMWEGSAAIVATGRTAACVRGTNTARARPTNGLASRWPERQARRRHRQGCVWRNSS